MPGPYLKFDREELQLTIGNLGGGWTFGQLGQLRLLDQAQLQLPSGWGNFKTAVAVQVIQTQWQLGAHLVLEQALEGGISFSRQDGVGSSVQMTHDLKYHLMNRPTTQIDLILKFKLEGDYDGDNFNGSGTVGLFLRGKF